MDSYAEKISISILCGFLAISMPAFATDNSIWFPDEAKASLEGLTEVNDIKTYSSLADIMLPVFGDLNSLVFTNWQGKTGSDQKWSVSWGGGYRQIFNESYIVGEYMYLDYNQTDNQNHFWELSPGLDYMTLDWDLHGNTYIPVGETQATLKYTTADKEGDTSQNVVIDGREYSPVYREIEGAGPDVDVAVGYIFKNFHHIHLTLGSYYFAQPHRSSVEGVEGQLEIPIVRALSAIVKDSFDNLKHNELLVGVKLSFDETPSATDLHAYMKNPILRNLATISSGSMGEITNARYATGDYELVRDK